MLWCSDALMLWCSDALMLWCSDALIFKNYKNMELQKTYSDSDKMSKLEIFVKNLYRPKHNFFEKVEKWKVDRMWRQVLALLQYVLINWKRIKLFQIWRNVATLVLDRQNVKTRDFRQKFVPAKTYLFWKKWKVKSWQNLEAGVSFMSIVFDKLKTT